MYSLPEGADCVTGADGTVEAGLVPLCSLVENVLVGCVPVVGVLRLIAAICAVGACCGIPRPTGGAPGTAGPGLVA